MQHSDVVRTTKPPLFKAKLREVGLAGIGEHISVAGRNRTIRALRLLLRCCAEVLCGLEAAAHEQARHVHVMGQLQLAMLHVTQEAQRRHALRHGQWPA